MRKSEGRMVSEGGRPIDSAQTRDPLAAISGVLTLLAPLTVAFAGMLYLAAWIHEARLVSPFGLSRDMFEHSLQDILAKGYLPLFTGTSLMASVLMICWLVTLVLPKRLVKAMPFTKWDGQHPFIRFNIMTLAATILL